MVLQLPGTPCSSSDLHAWQTPELFPPPWAGREEEQNWGEQSKAEDRRRRLEEGNVHEGEQRVNASQEAEKCQYGKQHRSEYEIPAPLKRVVQGTIIPTQANAM